MVRLVLGVDVMIDVNTIVFGIVFGLILATSIIMLLVYATIQAPQIEDDRSPVSHWTPMAKYESQRTYLHAIGHDPDVFDW
jgi:hypothetical protein